MPSCGDPPCHRCW